MATKLETLQAMIAPVVKALECDLWGIDYLSAGGRNRTVLRVYIDKEHGVGVDDCANVSRQLSSVMDVEDPILGEYTLEVSSPGLDRPLFTLEQVALYCGETAKVKLRQPFEGRRNYTGVIKGVEGDEIILIVDDHEFLLPMDAVDKAKIVPNFASSNQDTGKKE